MNLGTLIDELYETRQKRLEISKEVDKLKAAEVTMRGVILQMLDDMGMSKGTGSLATCGVTKSTEPVVEDWEAAHAYIRDQNRFDLLQKRLSAPAWRDLLETGVLVPGTSQVEVRDVSLTKSSRG